MANIRIGRSPCFSAPTSPLFSNCISSVALGLVLAGGAEASQVQSALAADKIGLTAQQLLATTLSTNIALPVAGSKPIGMGNVVAGVHLGTNTDIFAVGTTFGTYVDASEFWVRYTLDATSQQYHQYQPMDFEPIYQSTTPISGSLWLSFNTSTQALNAYAEEMTGSIFEYSSTASFYAHPEQASLSTLFGGRSGHPDYQPLPGANASMSAMACIECSLQWTLNLAFLELAWNGDGYHLLTSAQGFDQIYASSSKFPPYSAMDNYQANIAPVPVPAAAWLLGSSLMGLAAIRRRWSSAK